MDAALSSSSLPSGWKAAAMAVARTASLPHAELAELLLGGRGRGRISKAVGGQCGHLFLSHQGDSRCMVGAFKLMKRDVTIISSFPVITSTSNHYVPALLPLKSLQRGIQIQDRYMELLDASLHTEKCL